MSGKQPIRLDAVHELVDAVRRHPTAGAVRYIQEATWQGGLRTSSRATFVSALGESSINEQPHVICSDEPAALLGEDSAPSPGDLLLGALAGCYMVTLAANAAVLGLEMSDVRLHLEGSIDLQGFLGLNENVRSGFSDITVEVMVDCPGATEEVLAELIRRVERFSPIRNTLVDPVPVVTRLISAQRD